MCIVAGLSKVIHDPMYHLDKFKMTIIFSIVIYFENVFVVSLIGFVVTTKCYNSYLGYLTKISHLLQIFFSLYAVLLADQRHKISALR